MKKVFLRILPLAAAVLLATSCSKDENNDNNVVNNGQENVVVNEKTVSVSGTIDKKTSISKLACADGVNITFEGTETINFSGDDGKIHGSTTVAANGSFTVDLCYPGDQELDYLNNKSLTATIGTLPTGVTGEYDDINAAVKDIYETGTTTINAKIVPSWDQTTNYSVSLEPLTINVEVAFVENKKSEAISVKVGENDAVELAAGKICIVPAGATVTADGKTKTGTVAGEIYTVKVQTYTLKTQRYKSAEDKNKQNDLEMLEDEGGHKIANVTLPYTFSVRDFGNSVNFFETITNTPTVTEGSSYVNIDDIQGLGTNNYFNVTVTAATNGEIIIEFPVLNMNNTMTRNGALIFYIVAD